VTRQAELRRGWLRKANSAIEKMKGRTTLDSFKLTGGRRAIFNEEGCRLLAVLQNKLYVSGSFGEITILDTNDLSRQGVLVGHSRLATRLRAAGSRLVSCSYDGSVKVWNQKGQCTRSLQHGRAVADFVVLRGHLVLAASQDGLLVLWDLRQVLLAEQTSQLVHRAEVGCLAALDSQRAVAGCLDGSLLFLEVQASSLSVLRDVEAAHGKAIVAVLAAEGRVLTGSWDGTIKRWNYAGECLGQLHQHAAIHTIRSYTASQNFMILTTHSEIVIVDIHTLRLSLLLIHNLP
jgi:WD40 repeat protein